MQNFKIRKHHFRLRKKQLKKIIKGNSIIKDVKKIFKLKKIDDNTIKSMRNLFRLKLKTKAKQLKTE